MIFRWQNLAVVLTIVLIATTALAQEKPEKKTTKPRWLSGTALQQKLALPASVTWKKKPIAEALANLSKWTKDSKGNRLAIALDRRVDPTLKIDLEMSKEVPLETLLLLIANRTKLGLGWLGPIAYFGPKSITDRLRTVASIRKSELSDLPTTDRQVYLKKKTSKWEKLSTPREILSRFAKEGNITIENLDQLPHDLWPARELPHLSLVDRLSFVLGNFSLTYKYVDDGNKIRIVKIPEKVWVTLKLTGKLAKKKTDAQALAQKLKTVDIMFENNTMILQGRAEEIELISDVLAGRRRFLRSIGAQKTEHTLPINDDVSLVTAITYLAKKMDLKVNFHRQSIKEARISLTQKIPGVYKGETFEILMGKIIKPVGLDFSIKGKTIEIFPAKK